MATNSARHHTTGIVDIPVIGNRTGIHPRRPMPVAKVYQLKSCAEPAEVNESKRENEIPASAKKYSMFFRGKPREIEDDPFLKRLSRLK